MGEILFQERREVYSFNKQVPPELCAEGAGETLFDDFVRHRRNGRNPFSRKREVCSFNKQVPLELCTECARSITEEFFDKMETDCDFNR